MRLPATVSDLRTRRMRVVQFEGVRLRLGRRVLTEIPTVEVSSVPHAMRPHSRLALGFTRGCGLWATLGRQCPRRGWQP